MSKIVYCVFLAALLLALVGCSTGSPTPSAQPAASQPVTSAPAASSAASPTASTASPKLKIGSLPRIFDMIAFTAQQEGIYQKNGIEVEIVSFRSQVEKDNSMLTGATDGNIESAFGAALLNNNGDNCKLVGFFVMPGNIAVVVSPSSGITKIADLKGKDIGVSTGTTMEYALEKMLNTGGLTNKDVKLVNVPNMALRVEMLNQGKVAAAVLTPPLSVQAVASGNTLLIDDTNLQVSGPGILFSNEAIKTKSEAIARFIKSWQEATSMINANPEKYRGLLVKTANVPEAIATNYIVPVFPELRLPTQDDMTPIIDWMKSIGMVTGEIPFNRMVETKYLKK